MAKAQDISRNFFPYRAPLQPYAAYVALVVRPSSATSSLATVDADLQHRSSQGFSIILLVQGFHLLLPGHWNTSDFITRYLMVVLFPLIYFGARWWQKCETLDLLEIDFFSGSRECVHLSLSLSLSLSSLSRR